ncbi:hypothetical protein [Paenibacillus sp. GCM10027626]|uniref:hypothetical protein n=1 Tax=Paenibacillus sp. GCM10027626 TaxID=3273411 RepID=UPI00363F5B3B
MLKVMMVNNTYVVGTIEVEELSELEDTGYELVVFGEYPPEVSHPRSGYYLNYIDGEFSYEQIPTPTKSPQERLEALEEESTVTMLGLAQVYEEKETEVTNAMLATAEVYELLLQQQAVIEQMQVEIDQLKAAANGG